VKLVTILKEGTASHAVIELTESENAIRRTIRIPQPEIGGAALMKIVNTGSLPHYLAQDRD
jgi:hypothetical protein